MSPRQRRGLLILAMAVLGAVATFAAVLSYTQTVSQQLGPRRPVVVLVRQVSQYQPIDAGSLDVRLIPTVFAPPGALSSVQEVAGRVSPLPLPAGTFLQNSTLMTLPSLQFGQRAVTVQADPEMSVGQTISVNDVVDVVAAYRDGTKVTSLLQVSGARVLAVKRPDPDKDAMFVTMALSQSQARGLAAAQARSATFLIGRLPPNEEP